MEQDGSPIIWLNSEDSTLSARTLRLTPTNWILFTTSPTSPSATNRHPTVMHFWMIWKKWSLLKTLGLFFSRLISRVLWTRLISTLQMLRKTAVILQWFNKTIIKHCASNSRKCFTQTMLWSRICNRNASLWQRIILATDSARKALRATLLCCAPRATSLISTTVGC